jgi:hypothetical protein
VWGGERLTSELRGLPENLPTISKSADMSEKVPNPLNPHEIPVTLYVTVTRADLENSELSEKGLRTLRLWGDFLGGLSAQK